MPLEIFVSTLIGVSYWFLAAILTPTDIVEISVSATDTICIGISVHLYSQDKSSSLIGFTQCCKISQSPLSFFFFTAGSTCSVDSVSTAGSVGGGRGGGDKLSNFETASSFI